MSDLISREDLMNDIFCDKPKDVMLYIANYPTVDAVHRETLEQVMWERDVALHQLEEIGKGLGEKMDDVEPVRHGRWQVNEMFDYKDMTCLSCGWLFECHEEEWNYCPHCGAKMDEEETDG